MPRLENQQSRPAGEYVTSEVAAPARGQSEATLYRATWDVHPDDLADPTLSMDVVLEGSIDGTNFAVLARGDGWQGGQLGRDGNLSPPRLSWSASDNRVLTKVRVRWTQNKTAAVGCTLENQRVDA